MPCELRFHVLDKYIMCRAMKTTLTHTHIQKHTFLITTLFSLHLQIEWLFKFSFVFFSAFSSNQMMNCFMCFYFFFLFSLLLSCMPRDNEIFVLVLLCESLLQQIYWIIEKEKKKCEHKVPKNIPWSWWHSYGCKSWRIKKEISHKSYTNYLLSVFNERPLSLSLSVLLIQTHTSFNLYLFSV